MVIAIDRLVLLFIGALTSLVFRAQRRRESGEREWSGTGNAGG